MNRRNIKALGDRLGQVEARKPAPVSSFDMDDEQLAFEFRRLGILPETLGLPPDPD